MFIIQALRNYWRARREARALSDRVAGHKFAHRMPTESVPVVVVAERAQYRGSYAFGEGMLDAVNEWEAKRAAS